MPDIPAKFQKDPSITFRDILLTHTQTNKNQQKHYLLGGGKTGNATKNSHLNSLLSVRQDHLETSSVYVGISFLRLSVWRFPVPVTDAGASSATDDKHTCSALSSYTDLHSAKVNKKNCLITGTNKQKIKTLIPSSRVTSG